MGLQIVPQGLGGGTVTITGAGVPATGSPWKAPASSGPTVETFANGPVNGSATYYAFEISEIDVGAVGRILPGETVSLAAIVIQSSEDAAAALVRRGRGPRRRPAAATGRRRPPP